MKELQKRFDEFTEDLKGLGKIEDSVLNSIRKHMSVRFDHIIDRLDGCESPIEQLFALELAKVVLSSPLQHKADIFDFKNQTTAEFYKNDEVYKRYRVDFYLEFKDMKNGIEEAIVIECDGHEFHEKTKEQAAKDKKRDREFQKNGIMVMRFTGTEIFKDAHKCALEVETAMRAILKKYEVMTKEIKDSDLPF